ncbi:enoyl-CoA hydratase/isomerase family protein [Candidatus Woesearchaeota archaeon]|nr:enoyl-CoA hydratase/isomerase family protein [Candidatus Woesearchaeota archaeon]
MSTKIIFKKEKNIGRIILNNPEKLNAFNFSMIKELYQILEKIQKSQLKAVVVTGAGKAFCAGGDISWESDIGRMRASEAKEQIKYVQKVFSKIEQLPQAVIALINGAAVGGGNELAMACDIRVALPEAKFIHPENSLGTIAPLGGTKRLPRLVGLGRAKYMLFTGEAIDSKKALEWGLVDFLVPNEKISDFMESMLSRIERNPIKAIGMTKKSVNSHYFKDLTDKFEADSYVMLSRSQENKQILENFLRKKS